MTGIALVSYLILWVIVLGQMLILLALARQIGILHKRLAPNGARMTNVGLALGQEAPKFQELDIHQRQTTLGNERSKSTLLVFVSPGCSACSDLMPAIRTIARMEQQVEVVIISLLQDEEINQDFVIRYKLHNLSYIIAPHLAQTYQVTTSPYAILVDSKGKVYTKGLVNHLEHLESLLNALDEGVESFDEKMNTLMLTQNSGTD
ncbi:MAG: redoxin family protein [Chloroflexales bacterium]|nr:redoxin family protein [Chloroflexales bacterium]